MSDYINSVCEYPKENAILGEGAIYCNAPQRAILCSHSEKPLQMFTFLQIPGDSDLS